jgi:hypothetical protein
VHTPPRQTCISTAGALASPMIHPIFSNPRKINLSHNLCEFFRTSVCRKRRASIRQRLGDNYRCQRLPPCRSPTTGWTIDSFSRVSPIPSHHYVSAMHRCTTGAFHLILSMQYHLTRRARSREVRLLGGIVPFASFAPSRAVAIATTHQDPQHKVKWSTTSPPASSRAWSAQAAAWQIRRPR